MEKSVTRIYESLQKLVGLHRQLLDVVRLEREVLVEADLVGVQNVTLNKQSLIQDIYQAESSRLKATGELALEWKKPLRDLTLPNIIIQIQGNDLKNADQFRSLYNLLTVLIQRISEQNKFNMALIEKSLEHVHNMKRNILGEKSSQSATYSQQGQRVNGVSPSRLISKEA